MSASPGFSAARPRSADRELARQLRTGERDESDAALMAHLEATIADKIAIANPKWR